MKKKTFEIVGAVMGIVLFTSCQSSESPAEEANQVPDVEQDEIAPPVNYLETGQNLALSTKSALGKNLIAALGEKGAAGAVEFCNTKAIPITDSMSAVLNAKIKRVSDKPRNPSNMANTEELIYINAWKKGKARGEQHPPLMAERDGKMVGYFPIVANQMCLQCHGKPKVDINAETLNALAKLYPEDKATGYSDMDLRGIFVVEMEK